MHHESVGVVLAHDDLHIVEQVAEVLETAPGLFVAATSLDAAHPGHVVVAGGETLVTLHDPRLPLVALAGEDPLRAARAALTAGAREIVRWPDEAERLAGAIRRAATSFAGGSAGRGHVIAVMGSRGGVGTSTVAAALAASRSDAIVVDLDNEGAGQRAFAAEEPSRTIDDLRTTLTDLSPDVLASSLIEDAGGSRALHIHPHSEPLTPPQVHGLLRACRVIATTTVVDCARGVSLAAQAAAVTADRRVLIAATDLSSVRGARALLQREAGPTQLLVRRTRRAGVAVRDLVAALGIDAAAVISDDAALSRAVDLGTLPRKRNRSMRAITRLAAALEAANAD